MVTLDVILKLWQFLGIPLFGLVAYYVRDVAQQLRQINGRLTELETVFEERKFSVDTRFKTVQRELDQIQRRC